MQQHNVFCQQFRTTVQQMQSDYPNGDIPEFMYFQASNERDRTNNSFPMVVNLALHLLKLL